MDFTSRTKTSLMASSVEECAELTGKGSGQLPPATRTSWMAIKTEWRVKGIGGRMIESWCWSSDTVPPWAWRGGAEALS